MSQSFQCLIWALNASRAEIRPMQTAFQEPARQSRLRRTVNRTAIAVVVTACVASYPVDATADAIKISGLSKPFAVFLRSTEAQQIMRESSFIPIGKD